ncbi:MAG: adenosylcobinamide-phosphate synthase CbiB [Beijerinckiaceae bacterium]|nr:adenosylcobinamide-phosphate synthase CbiB [Beijerinckiaceae bacterium]
MTASLCMLLMALAFEALVGYPQGLFRRIGHPVTWMGAAIAWLDVHFNRDDDPAIKRRIFGAAGLGALLLMLILVAVLLQAVIAATLPSALALAIMAVLSSSLLAQRSLDQHVAAVASALERDGLAAGRKAVSMIVGRDPETLDEAGVCRAAIESLAESASDGVVAPALWLGLGGVAGGVFYKCVNTADSMIGHLTPRHRSFGWAAARLDDLINLPASRLTALLFVVAAWLLPGASASKALTVTLRDAGKHKSPNAGWPEAAMAGALSLQLAGPRVYDGEVVDSVFIGDGRRDASAADIRKALALWRIAAMLQFVLVGLLLALSAR